MTQTEPTTKKTINIKDQPAANQSGSAQQVEDQPQKVRRGERSRHKTEFYGHNIMISQIAKPDGTGKSDGNGRSEEDGKSPEK